MDICIKYCGLFIILTICCEFINCYEDACDRRPFPFTTAALPPDDRFKIDIIGATDKYLPLKEYTVRLYSTDKSSTFIAFSISVMEDTKKNDKNDRRPIRLNPGILREPFASDNARRSPICNNTVVQIDVRPKTSVEAIWTAPDKDNKCVRIYALVAVKEDVWYSFDGPLSKLLCEDRRKADDLQPQENDNCDVCEDAKYELIFEGKWLYNTHRDMFPTTQDSARFSDVIGASHNKNYYLYQYNSEASEGLSKLAEQENTTVLESEIQRELGKNVRTIIKASGQPKSNMMTSTSFRVSREHHFVSIVSAIVPSPDWFVGVSNLELCHRISNGVTQTNEWARYVVLNLYPMDAGVDNGKTFEASQDPTSPRQPIQTAVINKDILNKEEIKPFARLKFNLIRTYIKPNCTQTTITTTTEDDVSEDVTEPTEEETEAPLPIPSDETQESECQLTDWKIFGAGCEGDCVDGVLKGFVAKERHHIVNGRIEYDLNKVLYQCKNMVLNTIEMCEEECEAVPEVDTLAEN